VLPLSYSLGSKMSLQKTHSMTSASFVSPEHSSQIQPVKEQMAHPPSFRVVANRVYTSLPHAPQ
jgi:hypothetical protein